MKHRFLYALVLFQTLPAHSAPVTENELKAIRFDQRLGAQVSLDIPFVDENGTPVTLARYFGAKPVILVPGYYQCPMLCTLVLNGLTETLRDLRANAGTDFTLVAFSINPNETPQLAAAKERTYLRDYGRPGAAQGWHFLTGSDSSIDALTREIGFHYLYDPTVKQYAHPSGFVVLTPDGRITRYFFGVDYLAPDLDSAIQAAAAHRTLSPVEQLFLLCFHYSPLTGKYAWLMLLVVRLTAATTVLTMGLLIGRSILRERVRRV